jgi:hypothetical protein
VWGDNLGFHLHGAQDHQGVALGNGVTRRYQQRKDLAGHGSGDAIGGGELVCTWTAAPFRHPLHSPAFTIQPDIMRRVALFTSSDDGSHALTIDLKEKMTACPWFCLNRTTLATNRHREGGPGAFNSHGFDFIANLVVKLGHVVYSLSFLLATAAD